MTEQPNEATGGQTTGQHAGFGRFAAVSVLGSAIPGAGLLAARRWFAGAALLGAFIALVLGAITGLRQMQAQDLLATTLHSGRLQLITVGCLVLGVLWLLGSLWSFRVNTPRGLVGWQYVTAAAMAGVSTSVFVAPFAVGAYDANAQRQLVDKMFEGQGSSLGIFEGLDDSQVFAGKDRINILLLGSDAGPDRTGVRPDTMIVASTSLKTGDTVLFSMPRNLERTPFPPGSELAAAYPDGFTDPYRPDEYLLNAVYDVVPKEHPELLTQYANPGAEATKQAISGALGITVDYYVQVDLKGFEKIINALGGVTVNVHQRIPYGNKVLAPGVCSEPKGYIEPGLQHLDGYHALWYARARCGGEGVSTDYDRMRRQRCLIAALVQQLDPVQVLRSYQELASVTSDIVQTDIPESDVADFASLATVVKGAKLTSLPFTDRVTNSAFPDFALMQQMVADAIAPPKPAPSPTASATDSATPTETPTATPTDSGATPSDTPSPSPTGDESTGSEDVNDVC